MAVESVKILDPVKEELLPFAAKKRTRPSRGAPPMLRHAWLPYRQWDGPKLSWNEDFGKGKGQVYSRDGDEPLRSCNEVEVAKRLRTIRDHAFWISCYNPSQIPAIWRPWARAPEEAPAWLKLLDSRVRQSTGSATGGIPDVVAWNNTDPASSALLIECKGAKEDIKEGQEDWVFEAIRQGLAPEQFAVAIRHFVYSGEVTW